MKKIIGISLVFFTSTFAENNRYFSIGTSMSTAAIATSLPSSATPPIPKETFLTMLPEGFLPYKEFEAKFSLGTSATEQTHPLTNQLSQTMHKNVAEGLGLLLEVDKIVLEGMEQFLPSIARLAPEISVRLKEGGRVFLVGSGSSGRVGIDLAAKCNRFFPEAKDQIVGVIAGGDSALIRAREGFEDSENDGMRAIREYNITAKDTVILISGSGSASFNVGCGHKAANLGANVLYFYNSKEIPSRTQQLFDRELNPVIPFCIDIGAQAIAGSTRLQAATFAEAALGSLLASALYRNRGEEVLGKEYPRTLLVKIKEGIALIERHLNEIGKFSEKERVVFSDPRSNFRRLRDHTDQGYVTFIAREDAAREIIIDAVETSPTFSTNPVRREKEYRSKRAEFCAYLLGKEDNMRAWNALLGRAVRDSDIEDTSAFLVSSETGGLNSFVERPVGNGNFLIGVAKLKETDMIPSELMEALKKANETHEHICVLLPKEERIHERFGPQESKIKDGETGIILLCRGELGEEEAKKLSNVDAVIVLENVPYDEFGLAETIQLKLVLNLISNGSMVLMNKVHGNQMIDVRASNQKLIDRSMRLIRGIWMEYNPAFPLSNEELYHYVAHVSEIRNEKEKGGYYSPSVVKIVLAMLALKKTPADFDQVVDSLSGKEERIDWIKGAK